MTVNFANLVLNPCMTVFARTITIDPVWSQPGSPPYKARGILTSVPFDIATMENVEFSDQKTTIGIRLADWEGKPAPGPRDILIIDNPEIDRFPATGPTRFYIIDSDEDGQGGATLTIRLVTPINEINNTTPLDVE